MFGVTRLQPWQIDKARADLYWREVEQIIRDNVGLIANVHPSSEYEDAKLNRDYIVDEVRIACRLRWEQSTRGKRDLTIRSKRRRPDGTFNTFVDLHKIKKGFVRWYLYGWIDEQDHLVEWVIVDCFQALAHKLFDNRPEIPNADGVTWFIAIPITELYPIGAIQNGMINEDIAEQMGMHTS
jgi:hypothetical protein